MVEKLPGDLVTSSQGGRHLQHMSGGAAAGGRRLMKVDRREALTVLGSGLALGIPVAGRAQGSSPAVIRIGFVPVEVCAEAFYGVELGLFRDVGLDAQLVAFSNPGAIGAALVGGSIDVGLYDIAGLIAAHGHDVPLVFLATGQLFDQNAPIYSTVVAASSSIRSARDFEGAFAVSSVNNIAALGTLAWIDRNGGDSKRVKFVEVPFPLMVDAIERGTVNGGIPVEPFLTIAVQRGLRTVAPRDGIARSYVMSGWAAMRTWVDTHTAVAERFTRAVYQAGRWANRNHEASIPILAKYTKVPAATIHAMHRGTFAEATVADLAQPVIGAAVAYGLVQKEFPAHELYYRA